jgi:hypothetical protein
MGASVKTIDKTYGHFARDSEDAIRARLDAMADGVIGDIAPPLQVTSAQPGNLFVQRRAHHLELR